ncbi:MAG: hypothetical protein ACFE9L_12470 [Candidatus Hodarchaeota archaeon]
MINSREIIRKSDLTRHKVGEINDSQEITIWITIAGIIVGLFGIP